MHLVISEDFTHIENKTYSNKTLEYVSTDSFENFEKNKKLLGQDWYYYDKKIEYKYNSWGYRSKDFIDLEENYILTFGCSCTEGVGLHYDDLWSTKTANFLNMDCFNMGMGSTSTDFQFYNTLLLQNFFNKNNRLPKLVIYQWPSDYRTVAFYNQGIDDDDLSNLSLNLVSPHFDQSPDNILNKFFEWYKIGFVENKGELLKQSLLFPLACNNIWKNLNVPVIHWTYEDDSISNLKKKNFIGSNFRKLIIPFEDKARDCAHNGCKSQDLALDIIIDTIKTNNIEL